MLAILKRKASLLGAESPVLALACVVFLSINWCCFRMYSSGKVINPNSSTYITISSDHEIYVKTIEDIKGGEYHIGLTNNNAGISYLYLGLMSIFGDDLPLISLVVNNFIFLLSFLVLRRTLSLFGLPRFLSVLLLLNPATIYFSHLINKESFSLLGVLSMVYCVGAGRWKTMLLLIPLAMIVRFQLGIFGVALGLMFYLQSFFLWTAFVYVFFSLGGGLVVNRGGGFDPSLWGNGLVQTVYWLNHEYYIGSLLLNPARVLQYFADLCVGALDFAKNGGVAIYNFKDLPSLITLIGLSPWLVYMAINLHVYKDRPARVGICAVISYMLVQLMNPVIHARYLFPLLPVVFMLAFFVINEKRKAFPEELKDYK